MKKLFKKYLLFLVLLILVGILLLIKFFLGTKTPIQTLPQTQFTPFPSPSGISIINNEEDLQRREEEVRHIKKFFEENPLIPKLPHRENTFSITYEPIGNKYIVHQLFHGDKTIKEQLEESKTDALNWIHSQGVDPNSLTIEYTTN